MNAKSLKTFQKNIGYRFRRRSLLEEALTHPSFRHEVGNEVSVDNQRLEFLGDAVIGLVTADYLFRLPQELDEGTMTKFRSMVTSRGGLASLGERWEIGPLLRLGKGEEQSGGSGRESNLADAVEAVIGAVFLDGGMKACRKLFTRQVEATLKELLAVREESVHQDNPKGFLQELTQRHWQESPRYRIVEERGPAHDREYVAAVFWGEEELARGVAASKRAAEAKAASEALPLLQRRIARASGSEGTSS